MKNIRFKGQPYLFGGNSLDEDGFIATPEQYKNFEVSYAHYFPSSGVLRFQEKIGDREDIEILDNAHDE